MAKVNVLVKTTSVLLCLLLLTAAAAIAENFTRVEHPSAAVVQPVVSATRGTDAHQYSGTLRIYVVEPTSRYKDHINVAYNNGFLGYAYNQAVTLTGFDTLSGSVTWSGSALQQNNIAVIAALFNGTGHVAYADPDAHANQFTAYYVDAAAVAEDGQTGEDNASGSFTHTVFLEEGTANWCQYCPATRAALHTIHDAGNYPFLYAAMITDYNAQANTRMVNDYNIAGYPTCFYDGGSNVLVGGYSDTASYTPLIRNSGARATPDIYLSVTLTYLSATQLKVDYKVCDRELTNQSPTPTTPTGSPTEFPPAEDHTFYASGNDPDGDQIWIRYAFGDGDSSAWLGPVPSGGVASATHQWATGGTYAIKTLVKDKWEAAHSWSNPLNVTVVSCDCGDANNDQGIDISDAVFLIQYIFSGGAAPSACGGADNGMGDANGDGGVDISDAVFLIQYIFSGGAAPHCP